jgi:hypothetical protein
MLQMIKTVSGINSLVTAATHILLPGTAGYQLQKLAAERRQAIIIKG